MIGFLFVYMVCMIPCAIVMHLAGEKSTFILGVCAAAFIPALAVFAIIFPQVLVGG